MKINTIRNSSMAIKSLLILTLILLLAACGSSDDVPEVDGELTTMAEATSAETETEILPTADLSTATPQPTPTMIMEEATATPIPEPTEPPAEPTAEPPPAVVGDGFENVGTGRAFNIPGDNVFPEGVSYDTATGKFYVGSTTDGTLYVGDVNNPAEMTIFSPCGADERVVAVGTKVDSNGKLWVAGGRTGKMWVYDTTDGSLVAQFTTPAGEAFINDMAITDSGVYFTDSFRPIIWRVTNLDAPEAEAWLDLTGSAINYTPGFNLNGIVATPDGKNLIVVHSIEGELYRINTETKEVFWVQTGTIPLTAGDGLAYVNGVVYVLRNSYAEIVRIDLAEDLNSGGGGEVTYSDLFIYPTTLAFTGNTFLVANSQFNNQGGSPILPFTVAQIPLP